ncbi:hypothetical protein XELAEV_18043435mg [Xenopus laevis]|uniref:Uncharacterized protein n=1 Tax=Xenopus laevis TaxID=8355 RepID=A0A974BXJ1_XENLA|nr:hypothetical protein XELAEV_18043435mg [Xenopus laevis]
MMCPNFNHYPVAPSPLHLQVYWSPLVSSLSPLMAALMGSVGKTFIRYSSCTKVHTLESCGAPWETCVKVKLLYTERSALLARSPTSSSLSRLATCANLIVCPAIWSQ